MQRTTRLSTYRCTKAFRGGARLLSPDSGVISGSYLWAEKRRREGALQLSKIRFQPLLEQTALRRVWMYSSTSTLSSDPLRDEGINFYRFLMQNGVPSRCRQVMGTVHGTEIFISCCPDISRDTARDIVNLAREFPRGSRRSSASEVRTWRTLP
jgi:hypothetical protein